MSATVAEPTVPHHPRACDTLLDVDIRPALSSLPFGLVLILWTSAALADPPPSAPSAKAPPPAASADAKSASEESVARTIADGKLQRTLAVVTGSVGFGGLVVGGVFGILAVSRWNHVKATASSCRDPAAFAGCPLKLQNDQLAASSYATVANYGIVAGSAFIAGAIAMWYLVPRRPKIAAGIDLVPAVGKGAAGGFVLGAF